MTTQTGGAAFPLNTTNEDNVGAFYPHEGMTLRDYFASKAMRGMLAHATRYRPRPGASSNWHEAMSEEAYEIADAMLKARA